MLCVLVTADQDLAERARRLMAEQRVALVVAASLAPVETVLRTIVPSHLVIDLRQGTTIPTIRLRRLLGERADDVSVHLVASFETALEVLLELRRSAGRPALTELGRAWTSRSHSRP